MRHIKSFALLALCALFCSSPLFAQNTEANYDESKIAPYQLPDPLVFNNGKAVKTAKQWTKKRRAELLEIFSQEMYGHVPASVEGLHFKEISSETVYDGLALRRIVRIFLDAQEQHWFDVLIHQPKNVKGAVPVMVGLNFKGNDATLDERASSRWPYQLALNAGYAVATAWRDSIEPDGRESHIKEAKGVCQDGGVRAWYNKGGDWGAISAWAWGLSRIMDYIETDPALDASRVFLFGHSRLGKTALWGAANDTRFAAVASNCSGCCGAAISRRVIGENFAIIDRNFPHWFTREFDKYKGHEDQFPADQHCLAALSAPRPLYIVSASLDAWADPKGEWLCACQVAPVYALFGKTAVSGEMPAPDSPLNDTDVAYHVRTGKHDITAFDWAQYVKFISRYFNK